MSYCPVCPCLWWSAEVLCVVLCGERNQGVMVNAALVSVAAAVFTITPPLEKLKDSDDEAGDGAVGAANTAGGLSEGLAMVWGCD